MSEVKSIEVSAPDIEAAIEQGVVQLGVKRDEVLVEVLEEPGRRLLGLGNKQARVRLTVIRAPAAPPPTAAPTAPASTVRDEIINFPSPESRPPAPQPRTENRTPRPERRRPESREPRRGYDEVREPREGRENRENREQDNRPTRESRPSRGYHQAAHDVEDLPNADYEDDDDMPARPATSAADLAEEARIGTEVLQELLKNMDITAEVITNPSNTDGHEAQHWTLEIRGKELGVLIGRKGETLAALQYITRLITSKQIGHRANLVIDVEGYKARREAMLQRLAQRMAEQAVQRGRTVSMEPMPPHERRIIHLTLRNHPDVTTESVGEGDRRKVTVIPRHPK